MIKWAVESEKRNEEKEGAAESCAFCQLMDNFVREYPAIETVIIQQIRAMPIYGQRARGMCHPYTITDIRRYT